MGVQCKLLGHVHDSTEFEERRETRPNGTVLICREYQVCRRCGDREEMYRNEQVLAPAATEADTRTADATSELETNTDESETQQPTKQNGQDTTRAPAEADTPDSDSTDTTAPPTPKPGVADDGQSDDVSGDTAGDSSRANSRVQRPSDTASHDHETDDAVILSESPTDVHSPTENTPTEMRADGTGHPHATPVTDDAVILSDAPEDTSPSPSTRHRPTRTNSTAKPNDSLTSAEETGSPTASLTAAEHGHGQINCTTCGLEWRRNTTSLREGDLCPECQDTYIKEA